MDKAKRERISNFLRYFPEYSVTTLAEWLRETAPDLKTSTDRAYHRGMNEFLGAVCGKECLHPSDTPIPFVGPENPFGSEAWLFLGNYGITLEDCADYVSEYRRTEAQKEQAASMSMSNVLRALPGGEHEGVYDLLERHERINAPAEVSMSQFLQDMRAGNDAQAVLRSTDAQ